MMKKEYIFKNIEDEPFIYDCKIKGIVDNYRNTLKLASYFIMAFLKTPRFVLELIKEEYSQNNFKIVLKAIVKSKQAIIIITSESLKIQYEKEELTITSNWDHEFLYASLNQYQVILPDRKITEQILHHRLKIEIEIKDKIWSLDIPYETSNYLHPYYFASIKESTSIMDLKEFYKEHFFLKQTSFEKGLATTLRITKQLSDNQKIVLDEFSILDGFVDKYILSSFNEGLLIQAIGKPNDSNKITISGYQVPCHTNINEEIERLLIRSRKVNFK